MEMPTTEALGKEKELYTAYLNGGGEPIRLHLELRPADGDAMNWNLGVEIPDDLPKLRWTLEFTDYIRDKVKWAIQPPKIS
jgi:hypothetical protein